MIYHITNKKIWSEAIAYKTFRTDSLSTEGFIHCSPIEKIIETADNFYKGQDDLKLLCIEESKVINRIIYEDLYDHGFNFPHIYGELNLDAIAGVKDLKCGSDGKFKLPEGI